MGSERWLPKLTSCIAGMQKQSEEFLAGSVLSLYTDTYTVK